MKITQEQKELLTWNKKHYNLHATIKLSKTEISKIIQIGGFFVKLLGPLMNVGLPSMKNVTKPLPKIILITLGLSSIRCTYLKQSSQLYKCSVDNFK